MWRVVALDREGREVGRVEAAAGEVTIGRDPDRQLVLPSPSVSRRHARVLLDGQQPCVVDEGSANGVLVNGMRIGAATVVGSGIAIDVAEYRLVVEPLRRMEERPQSLAPVTIQSLRLVAQGGPYAGRVFELPLGDLGVGRTGDNALVFDDPSLSRRHASLRRQGEMHLEIEDLGSSNGTFVNGRKVGRGTAKPGDLLRFGELQFRVESNLAQGRRSFGGSAQLFGLIAGGLATLSVAAATGWVLLRRPAPVRASGAEGIAAIARQAEQHLRAGRTLYGDRKYAEARAELELALESDPGSAEARRLKMLATRAPDDERALSSALAALAIGDRKGLETALRLREEITQGATARTQLSTRLGASLVRYGLERCQERNHAECAWSLCRAAEVAPDAVRDDERVLRGLRDAEKKLQRDRGYVRCRSLP